MTEWNVSSLLNSVTPKLQVTVPTLLNITDDINCLIFSIAIFAFSTLVKGKIITNSSPPHLEKISVLLKCDFTS